MKTMYNTIRGVLPISRAEYDLIECIIFHCAAPDSGGWCCASRGDIAATMGCTTRWLRKMISTLETKGLVVRGQDHALRVTSKVYNAMSYEPKYGSIYRKVSTEQKFRTVKLVRNFCSSRIHGIGQESEYSDVLDNQGLIHNPSSQIADERPQAIFCETADNQLLIPKQDSDEPIKEEELSSASYRMKKVKEKEKKEAKKRKRKIYKILYNSNNYYSITNKTIACVRERVRKRKEQEMQEKKSQPEKKVGPEDKSDMALRILEKVKEISPVFKFQPNAKTNIGFVVRLLTRGYTAKEIYASAASAYHHKVFDPSQHKYLEPSTIFGSHQSFTRSLSLAYSQGIIRQVEDGSQAITLAMLPERQRPSNLFSPNQNEEIHWVFIFAKKNESLPILHRGRLSPEPNAKIEAVCRKHGKPLVEKAILRMKHKEILTDVSIAIDNQCTYLSKEAV